MSISADSELALLKLLANPSALSERITAWEEASARYNELVEKAGIVGEIVAARAEAGAALQAAKDKAAAIMSEAVVRGAAIDEVAKKTIADADARAAHANQVRMEADIYASAREDEARAILKDAQDKARQMMTEAMAAREEAEKLKARLANEMAGVDAIRMEAHNLREDLNRRLDLVRAAGA